MSPYDIPMSRTWLRFPRPTTPASDTHAHFRIPGHPLAFTVLLEASPAPWERAGRVCVACACRYACVLVLAQLASHLVWPAGNGRWGLRLREEVGGPCGGDEAIPGTHSADGRH